MNIEDMRSDLAFLKKREKELEDYFLNNILTPAEEVLVQNQLELMCKYIDILTVRIEMAELKK